MREQLSSETVWNWILQRQVHAEEFRTALVSTGEYSLQIDYHKQDKVKDDVITTELLNYY